MSRLHQQHLDQDPGENSLATKPCLSFLWMEVWLLWNFPSGWQMFLCATAHFYCLSPVLVGFCVTLKALSIILRLSGRHRVPVWQGSMGMQGTVPKPGSSRRRSTDRMLRMRSYSLLTSHGLCTKPPARISIILLVHDMEIQNVELKDGASSTRRENSECAI